MKKVVAISRAIGAEGEFIGTLVAEKLGYRYVDEEIIADAAEKQGVDPAAIADAERRKSVLLRVIEGFGQSGAANATATPGGPMWIPDDSSELVRSHDLRALIRETGIRAITMTEIDRIGIERAVLEAIDRASGPGFVHVSLDLSRPEGTERLGWIYRHGRVHSQTTAGDRVDIEVDLPRRLVAQLGAAEPSVSRKARRA